MTAQTNASEQAYTQALDREDDLVAGSLRAGMLNQLLREQLAPAKPNQTTDEQLETGVAASELKHKITLLSSAVSAVDEILNCTTFNRDLLHDRLSQLYHQQKYVYESTDIDDELRKRQFISHCGLIMSPDNCITTQLDDLRVRAFIRGLDQAITDISAKRPGPVHVVYPACGPFAPLLMPLLGYYKARERFGARQVRITLIDIQPGAVKSLEALAESMGVKDYIRQILCMDALTYDPGERPVDIVLLEAMQHGFSREGQFSLARYFAQMLEPDGILLPQEIVVTAALNDPNKEFVAQWQQAKRVSFEDSDQGILNQRKVLGEVAKINRETLTHCREREIDQYTTLIEFGKVQVPHLPADLPEQILLMCCEVHVYKDWWLREYDSGITHPLPDSQVCINFTPRDERPGDLLIKSGDAIQFFYRVNGLPGFLATWAPGESL